MSKQLSADKLMQMTNTATSYTQHEKNTSFSSVFKGALAASIVGVIALTSAYYSTSSTVIEPETDMLDMIIYESFESDSF